MLSYYNAWVTSDPPYIGCTVLVRFDDGEAIKFSVSSAADNSSETIFLNNYSKFVEKVKKAKLVRISVNIYQQGAPVFEFDVSRRRVGS